MNLIQRLLAFNNNHHQDQPESQSSAVVVVESSNLAGISHLYWATFGRVTQPTSKSTEPDHKDNNNKQQQSRRRRQSLVTGHSQSQSTVTDASSHRFKHNHNYTTTNSTTSSTITSSGPRSRPQPRQRRPVAVSYEPQLEAIHFACEPTTTTSSSPSVIDPQLLSTNESIVIPNQTGNTTTDLWPSDGSKASSLSSSWISQSPQQDTDLIDIDIDLNSDIDLNIPVLEPKLCESSEVNKGNDDDDDWVFLNVDDTQLDLLPDLDLELSKTKQLDKTRHSKSNTKGQTLSNSNTPLTSDHHHSSVTAEPTTSASPEVTTTTRAMTLDKQDIELIRASWSLVRQDPPAGGLLLFKGLFTKFPQYLKFFPQFADLDLDRLQDNKRLLKHAVRVIDTVTYLVDTVGEESKQDELAGNIIKLVKSHLRRRIGLAEFKNLGIVLIDFICDVNQRQSTKLNDPDLLDGPSSKIGSSSNASGAGSESSIQNQPIVGLNHGHSSIIDRRTSLDQSETMTDALDKLHGSSSLSSSSSSAVSTPDNDDDISAYTTTANKQQKEHAARDDDDAVDSNIKFGRLNFNNEAILDTNALVSGWTKFYGGILDLVKLEESADPAQADNQA